MQSFLSELKERLSELMKDAGCRPQMTIRRAGREEYLLAAPVFLRESRQTAEALIQRVQQDGIPVIYVIEMSTRSVARTVAEETGAAIREMHSLQTVTQAEFDAGESYVSLMRRNVEAVREGLS